MCMIQYDYFYVESIKSCEYKYYKNNKQYNKKDNHEHLSITSSLNNHQFHFFLHISLISNIKVNTKYYLCKLVLLQFIFIY